MSPLGSPAGEAIKRWRGVRRLPENVPPARAAAAVKQPGEGTILGSRTLPFPDRSSGVQLQETTDETFGPFQVTFLPAQPSASATHPVRTNPETQVVPIVLSKPALVAGERTLTINGVRQVQLLDSLFARRNWWNQGEEGEPWTA